MRARELLGGVEFYPIGDSRFTVKSMGYLSGGRSFVGVEPNAFGIEFFTFGKGVEVTTVAELTEMVCKHCGGKGCLRSGPRNVCQSCGRIQF